MSEPRQITLQMQIAPCERAGVIAAGEQLVDSLSAVPGHPHWTLNITFTPPGEDLEPAPGVSAIILSMLPEVEALDEPMALIQARWRQRLAPLVASHAPVYLRTVFRRIQDRPTDGTISPLLERIHRLNRLALDLSHEFGLGIIDIDRCFAHIGGKVLGADWRTQNGWLAAEAAGHTMAWSLLSCGMGDEVDPLVLEQAREILGGLERIDALINRRAAQRQAAQAAS